ncbi:hypothetical protein MPER_15080, partial [Moniliophthora perniciosa FA553]
KSPSADKPTPGLRPKCRAGQRIYQWETSFSISQQQEETEKYPPEVLSYAKAATQTALADSTATSYGAGLKRFMEFCDEMGIEESLRMPADATLLSSFVGRWLGEKSGSTVQSWLSGIRQWHIQKKAPWCGDSDLVKLARKAANQAGAHRKRDPRAPVSRSYLVTLKRRLDLSKPKHAAIWGCATSTDPFS